MTLEQIYYQKCNSPSDINEHLPTLKRYADECEHITEMGVRWVVSTYAFLMGKPKKLVSIDIDSLEKYGNSQHQISSLAPDTEFEFVLGDTLKIDIEPTDFLFLDTWHVYDQVKGELARHASKVSKYIGFHDTTTFEERGETSGHEGIWPAVQEFLDDHPEWVIKERYTNNNGLTILEKVGL